MSTYSTLLKHPEWQKKRLEVFNRDNFTCKHCNCSTKELHVHHIGYSNGNPWEISNDLLITLCSTCHTKEEQNIPFAIESLTRALRTNGFMSGDILQLSWLVSGKKITSKNQVLLGNGLTEKDFRHDG